MRWSIPVGVCRHPLIRKEMQWLMILIVMTSLMAIAVFRGMILREAEGSAIGSG